MSDSQGQDLNEIEVLLASRQRVTEWLDRLHAAGSKTPPSVRQRVQRDYESRLAQVVDQLRGHSDFVTSSLHGLRAQAEQFEQLRADEQETLSEAELRHVVGEYNDGEWGHVERESSQKIGGLDSELGRLAGEIRRLEEVLSLIAPTPMNTVSILGTRDFAADFANSIETDLGLPQQPPLALVRDELADIKPEPMAPPPVPAPAAAHAPHPMEIPEAPRFVPRPAEKLRASGPVRAMPYTPLPVVPAPSPAQQPAAMDELTFLKSMTLDRHSGQSSAVAATPHEVRTDRPSSQTVPKTLKCGECGSLNRPTEWYCERCGAELAAV